jgi:hypothetical protein
MRTTGSTLFAAVVAVALAGAVLAAEAPKTTVSPPKAPRQAWWLEQGRGGLEYRQDEQGNRVPDFSYCGYMGGGVEIPNVPVKVVVEAKAGDATRRIQAAIDYVATLPADDKGVRGAVLLRKGTYEVGSQIVLNASGVVLRGEGMGQTTILATGYDRRMLIRVLGTGDIKTEAVMGITDSYVPVGAMSFSVKDPNSLKVGDTIFINRPCTPEWLAAIGMDSKATEDAQPWRPGSRTITWDRVVKKIEGTKITVDAPITTAIESKFGGGEVEIYTWQGRIGQVGIENLTLDTTYDKANPVDEAHAWIGVTMENAQNAWVRQVEFKHFSGGAVQVWESCKLVTVEDCKSIEPIGELGGFRRHTFLTGGQMTLFLRCWSEQGRHDFTTWYCAAGPNAFVWCQTYEAREDSGPMFSWAGGVLFDNVKIDGARLSLGNRYGKNAGAGWAAANCMLWNCMAAEIHVWNPPTAMNWATGCWARFTGDGAWGSVNDYVNPQCLYQQQLTERVGRDAAQHIYGIEYPGGSTRPTYKMNEQMVADSMKPAEQVIDLVNEAAKRNPIPTVADGVKTVEEVASAALAKVEPAKPKHKLALQNGWLTVDGQIVGGGRTSVMWWRGSTPPTAEDARARGITRFVPGRTGPGWTDDLDQLTGMMRGSGTLVMDYHYALWQERRRDDHERIRRMDGDVWPPFYELPFARSGQGTMWNGLSKYDLTKYDKWYWLRMKQFVDLCDEKGLVIFNQNYFQHNIIEAGAHWADFPWRSANNINNTGFPEPPPYVSTDKRIVQSQFFYDVNHPVRRELHKAYIRQCLNAFADNTNVIQFTSDEYTGPLHFTQFWLDTIAEWEKETGKHPLIALSCTKDVQDAILADPVRSKIVDVIDIRYWHYQASGTAYAPAGGLNMAPRQHDSVLKPKPTSFDQEARAVGEYRVRFPDKAVIYSAEYGSFPVAAMMAGGSLTDMRGFDNPVLTTAMAAMKPLEAWKPGSPLVLAEAGKQYMAYDAKGDIKLDLTSAPGTFAVRWVRLDGIARDGGTVDGGKVVELKAQDDDTPIVWISKR